MPSMNRPAAHHILVPVFALGALLGTAFPASAQGFGLGARFAWVKHDVEMDVDRVRFTGFHVRATGGRTGFELSFDRHSEEFPLINHKVIETPIQASLLLRLASGSFAPYLLGGPGWYKRKVELIEGPEASESATDFGWHAGGGVEIHAGRHIGIHGDYRYTFLDFNGDDDDDDGGNDIPIPVVGGLLPGYKGSMFTLGATVYF
jgi:opacity protein-like surface antigen